MTTSNEQEGKRPLKLSRPGRLELKKTIDGGQVRQSFPHGRTKTVAVEIKRKRSYAPGAGGRMTEVAPAAEPAPAEPAPVQVETVVEERHTPVRHLTVGERQARLRALEEARRDDEARRLQEAERARAEAEARRHAEEERRQQEAEARRRAEEEARATSEVPVQTSLQSVEGAPPATEAAAVPEARPKEAKEAREAKPAGKPAPRPAGTPVEEEEEVGRIKRAGAKLAPKLSPLLRRNEPRRRVGKLTIAQALEDSDEERMRSLASLRRTRERERQRVQQMRSEGIKVIRDVVVPETITAQELANRMAERVADVIKALMKMGIMVTINQPLDGDTAELVVAEFGHRVRRVSAADVELGLDGEPDAPESLQPRPPVVTVMGHVDHGKTSLLDALRQTDVAAHEAGGITQHIGAYQVTRPNGQKITFIDTPGHAAFTEMRARGAHVTDIVVLVVAADDGIMEQTVEAINHAKAAKVPLIVAINKIDKAGANPDRVRQELLQHGVVTEEMGGETLSVEVSATKKVNLDKLEEAILLQAELLDLRANPQRRASGAVIEARLERGRGVVATLLVQRGTLGIGDVLVAGSEWGRVRALLDDRGNAVTSAGPSTPVEVLGLQGTPMPGETFAVVESEARAREISEFRQRRHREATAVAGPRGGSLEDMFSRIAAGAQKELAVIIKADVQGSLEAIAGSLTKLSTNEVSVRVLHAAVGGISESDVTLARASNAIIIGFNVRANPQAREMARRDKVDIRYYSIIYNVVDDVRAALSGLLAPTVREKFLGYAQVLEVFAISKVGKVAGCRVTEGVVRRGAKVRLLRDNVVIHEGALKTLKRFKDEVREVKEGFECGMAFENYQDIQVGDQIECFELEEVARALA
ncbi:MAG: translation initiation factor IF-2 [Rhodospirillaceae bacterium]|nr:translation initiation factor IF-2 [Rhodospirillaceae bacterium]